MYFPYLHGRRSELLALRSTKQYLSSGTVVPIVEPVVEKPADLLRCMDVVGKDGHRLIIITNPYQGELKGGPNPDWKDQVTEALNKHESLVPAFICHSGTTVTQLRTFLKKYRQRDVALLYLNPGYSDADMQAIALLPDVAFHIVLQSKLTAHQRKLLPKGKRVYVQDTFNKQARNADYAGAEHFTDAHKVFAKQGVGFGDYTVIGSHLQIGGGPPGAVAIHVTYKEEDSEDIWIEHFLSDETDVLAGTVEGKYLQAVSKLAEAHAPRAHEFGFNPALDAYLTDHLAGNFPGLGKNKERQIQHHIALMHGVLNGEL